MRANLAHLLQVGPQQALTGPVERGDTATVAKHLACLTGEDARQVYRGASRMLVEQYGGRVPDTMEELLKLPGVGRKTANLILGDVYHTPSHESPGGKNLPAHLLRLLHRPADGPGRHQHDPGGR